MKEKIQQLADSCWTEDVHVGYEGTTSFERFDYEKFAELIAKECANICDSYAMPDGTSTVAVLLSNAIRRRFDI